MPYKAPGRNAACKRAYRIANREKTNRRAAEAYRRDPEVFRARALRYYNKKTALEKRELKRRSRGLPSPTRAEPENCEVCDVSAMTFSRGLHLDHDHLLDRFRGWLCPCCNRAIGEAKDSPVILRALAAYLERSRR